MNRITVFEHPEGKEQAANYTALVKEMENRGTKGAFGATLNPLPDVRMVDQVIREDAPEVVNGQVQARNPRELHSRRHGR